MVENTSRKKPKRKRRNKVGPNQVAQFPGERKIVLMTLPLRTWDEIHHHARKEAIPLSSLPRSQSTERGSGPRFATINAFHDHAVDWFVTNPAIDAYDSYVSPLTGKAVGVARKTYWLNSELWKCAEAVGERDGVQTSRVLHTAILAYLQHLVRTETEKDSKQKEGEDSKPGDERHRSGVPHGKTTRTRRSSKKAGTRAKR